MRKLLVVFLTFLTLLSCGENETSEVTPTTPVTGSVSFSVSAPKANKEGSRSARTNNTPFQIVVTVANDDGDIINNERYNLVSFNGAFISDPVKLPIGGYTLTKFNVVNSDNEVIFSAPLAGSEMAKLVSLPLPLSFTITDSNTSDTPTVISPEVLAVDEDDTAEQFGYASFTFSVVETVNLYIFVVKDTNINSDGSLVDALLRVTSVPDRSDFIEFDLPVGVNKIKIPLLPGSDEVSFDVSTEGFEDKNLTFTIGQINEFSQDNPLMIEFNETPVDGGLGTIRPDFTETIIAEQVNTEFVNTNLGSWNGFLGDLFDITNFRNEIVAVGGTNRLVFVQDQGDQRFIQTYTLSGINTFLSDLNTIDGGVLIITGIDSLYILDDFSTKSFRQIVYSDLTFPQGSVKVINGDIYVLNENRLYRSSDMGESFTLLNENLPFSQNPNSKSQLIEYNGGLAAIGGSEDVDAGQVYASNFDGEFFNDIFVVNEFYIDIYDFSEITGGTNDLIFTGGNDSGRYIFNSSTREEVSRDNIGEFSNLVSVDGEFRITLGSSIYEENTNFTNLNDGFSFVKVVSEAPTKITTLGNQQVWGIANNTIFWNLR